MSAGHSPSSKPLEPAAHGPFGRLLEAFLPAAVFRGRRHPGGIAAAESFWREIEQDILHCLVRPGDIAIDVGANAGGYVQSFLEAGCRCIAFECNPRLERALAERYRGDDRVVVRGEALSSEAGVVELRIPMRGWSESDGGATIDPANPLAIGFWPVRRIAVRRCRLDEAVSVDVAAVKVDVEGHEYDVLRGATAILDRCSPAILVECEERHHPGATNAMFRFLADRGYRGFFIFERRVRPIGEFTLGLQNPAELAKGLPRRETRYVNNFLFLHDRRDPQAVVAAIDTALRCRAD